MCQVQMCVGIYLYTWREKYKTHRENANTDRLRWIVYVLSNKISEAK